jgi:hypothetical protein
LGTFQGNSRKIHPPVGAWFAHAHANTLEFTFEFEIEIEAGFKTPKFEI